MIKTPHACFVVHRTRQRTPQEELVDAAIAAIGIAADEVHVEAFKIGGGIRLAGDREVLESFDMTREQRLDG